MQADFVGLTKHLKQRLQMYEYNMGRQASSRSIAQLLSTALYSKRFFPFYTFNCLVGLDENGDGSVFGYDAIGSFDRVKYVCMGSAQQLIIPILDNQLLGKK